MVSTMELSTLARLGELEPGLRRGWTYPRVTKDWTSKRWAKAPMLAALVWMRKRLPGLAARELPKMGVEAMWVYHPLVSPQLARITDLAGVELIAWTVDDPGRMSKLVAAGVNGICSNDPRLFASLPGANSQLPAP
jgi:glycerophosphoryl diester phosphodiesterase